MTGAAPPVATARRRGLHFPPHFILAGGGVALILTLAVLTRLTVRETDFRHFLLRTDFPAFLTGARLIAAGQGAALYDPAAQAPVQAALLAPYVEPALLPYNHLPFLAVALAPLTGLALPWSYGVWFAATVGALLAAVALLHREMRAVARTPSEKRWAPWALWTLALGFVPLYQDLLQVQTAPWDLLGYTLMIRYLRQGREVAAGLALGLVLIKPQLLIVPLLVLLYGRRWRTLAAFAALGGGLSLLVTPLLGGFGWVGRYLAILANVAGAGSTGGLIQPGLMENLRGFFTRLAIVYGPAGAGGGRAAWVLPATALASLLVLAGLAWAWRGRAAFDPAADPAGWDARWAATLLAAVLVSPHSLPYELTLWLLPGVLAWRAAREGAAPGAVAPTAALLAAGYAAATVTLPLFSIPGWPLHIGVLAGVAAIALLLTRPVSGGPVARFHLAWKR